MGSRLDKNSHAVRKRIENHTFADEEGDEYNASSFGGFSGYFRNKKIKLQNLDEELRTAAAGKPTIFKGVVAHVSGYTQPPLHHLHRELVQHGAGFLQYLDSKTMATHIIASSLPPKKSVEFRNYRVVKPAWVVDSIQAGKMLPWADYRLIDEGPRQEKIRLEGGKMYSQRTQESQPSYKEHTENSFYMNQIQKRALGLSQATTNSPAIVESQPTAHALEGTDIEETDISLDPMPHGQAGGTESASQDSQGPVLEPAPTGVVEDVGPKQFPSDGHVQDLQLPDPEPVESDAQSPRKSDTMTSEEHNAWLLSDPRIRKSSTANPNFLKQYYSESRLHHLSTWKAELKSKMQRLAAEKGGAPKDVKRKARVRRYIMHVDFDSFFCAVSLKNAPEYVDKPAVVAHGNGSGSEIASCNYAARKFGVKNGMWMKKALELCPDIKVLPYNFPAYEEASGLFYESIIGVGGTVQSISIDEALVDITTIVLSAAGSDGVGVKEGSIWREQEEVDKIAIELREQIKQKTGCAVSIGIGANVLLAKVALRKAKPAGQYQVRPEHVLDILGDLPVENLPGVAHSIRGKLEEVGIKLVKDIRAASKERLVSVLGPKTGERLWEYSQGVDGTEVGDQPIRKSVSAEVNWGIRFISQEEAEEFVMNLSKELERRLLNEQVKGKSLTMKIMRRSLDAPLDPAKHLGHGKCDTFNKSVLFGVATNNAELIGREAVSILRSFRFNPGDLRGLGVQLQKLEPIKALAAGPDGSQKRLSFGNFSATSTKKSKTDPIEDDISYESDRPTPGKASSRDPIADDPLTPKKPKISPIHPALALARAGEADAKARTPLNMAGTQFIMPTNPDPGVLAELPPDIRSRLMAQQRRISSPGEQSPSLRSRTHSPALQDEIPPQFDLEVFNALPDDMKAEVLASYGRKGGRGLLAQSPRKDRTVHHPPPKKTPTKRGIRGMFRTARERQHDSDAKLRQTNFMTDKGAVENGNQVDDDIKELDQEFLAELPEEVRREVIEDHRRRRLAQRSGLDLQVQHRRGQAAGDGEDALPGGQTRLQFPAAPARVAFANLSGTSVREMKDMLDTWHRETQREGPHRADVEMLEAYLARVVAEERDMEKARKLVSWLDWVVEEDGDGAGKRSWRVAVAGIKDEVQKAVKLRGLGPMDFE